MTIGKVWSFTVGKMLCVTVRKVCSGNLGKMLCVTVGESMEFDCWQSM